MSEPDEAGLDRLLAPFNPWWSDPKGVWRREVPGFERPLLAQLVNDLAAAPQMISVTGPRRVGKTTLLRQLVIYLLDRQGVGPERILYFSLDDPALFTSPALRDRIVDLLVEHRRVPAFGAEGVYYFLLDEIQRLPHWELFLKKFYDLGYPIRFVVSGSASVPIARESRESLAGRIRQRHLLPFSFREFCLYRLSGDSGFRQVLGAYPLLRAHLLEGRAAEARDLLLRLDSELLRFRAELDRCTQDYFRDGGFPEIWQLADPAIRQEHLWDSFIKRVLFEDLAMPAERRKPENLARLCLYLMAHPGQELNTSRIAREAAVTRQAVEADLPLLESTHLVQRVRRFRSALFRPKEGNFKCYVVDLALHHAVARTWDSVARDDRLLGTCAENLVANHLASWAESLELAYYRDEQREVDFVVTAAGGVRLPVEVKHRREMEGPRALEWFARKHDAPLGVVVTREQATDLRGNILSIPLRYFLLAT